MRASILALSIRASIQHPTLNMHKTVPEVKSTMEASTRKRKVEEDVLAEDEAAEASKKAKETTDVDENAPAPPTQQGIDKPPPHPVVTDSNGTDNKADEPGTLKTGGGDDDDGPDEKSDSAIPKKDEPAEEVRKAEQPTQPPTTTPSVPAATVPADTVDEQLDDKKIIQDTSELPPSYVGRVIGKGQLYWVFGLVPCLVEAQLPVSSLPPRACVVANLRRGDDPRSSG